PRLLSGSDAGLYVPRHQPSATLRVRITEILYVRTSGEVVPPDDAFAVPAGGAPVPNSFGGSVGPGIGVAGFLGKHLWLGASFDTLAGFVPSTVVATCISCGTHWSHTSSDLDVVPIARFQAGAGVRFKYF